MNPREIKADLIAETFKEAAKKIKKELGYQ